MTDADQPMLLQTLLGVYAYYDKELSELALSVWIDDLDDHEIGDIERAFVAHRRDPERGQWCPKSADILRRLDGGQSDAAHVAWTALLDQVRSVGSHSRPNLDQATRNAIETLGGWGAVCRAEERELPHMQRRFSEAYSVWRDRAARGEDLPILAGITAQGRLQ